MARLALRRGGVRLEEDHRGESHLEESRLEEGRLEEGHLEEGRQMNHQEEVEGRQGKVQTRSPRSRTRTKDQHRRPGYGWTVWRTPSSIRASICKCS